MKAVRLSPNEEAAVIQKRQAERRKARIIQVREQDRGLAYKLRQEINDKKELERRALQERLQYNLANAHHKKLKDLEAHYLARMEELGMAHREAQIIEQEDVRLEDQRVLLEAEKNWRAGLRSKVAIKKLNTAPVRKKKCQEKLLETKKRTREVENRRASRVAHMSVPTRRPLIMDVAVSSSKNKRNDQHLRYNHRVQFKEADDYGCSYYHIPQVVWRDTLQNTNSANEVAKQKDEADKLLSKQAAIAKMEQDEKARIRHMHALAKVKLERDKVDILSQLSVMEREDRTRRQKAIAMMPNNLFQPVHKRLEMASEQQRDMEQAFEKILIEKPGIRGVETADNENVDQARPIYGKLSDVEDLADSAQVQSKAVHFSRTQDSTGQETTPTNITQGEVTLSSSSEDITVGITPNMMRQPLPASPPVYPLPSRDRHMDYDTTASLSVTPLPCSPTPITAEDTRSTTVTGDHSASPSKGTQTQHTEYRLPRVLTHVLSQPDLSVADTVSLRSGSKASLRANDVNLAPQVAYGKTSAPQVASGITRSPQVMSELPRVPQVTSEMHRAPQVTSEMAKGPQVTYEMPRGPQVLSEMPRGPQVLSEMPRGTSEMPKDIQGMTGDPSNKVPNEAMQKLIALVKAQQEERRETQARARSPADHKSALLDVQDGDIGDPHQAALSISTLSTRDSSPSLDEGGNLYSNNQPSSLGTTQYVALPPYSTHAPLDKQPLAPYPYHHAIPQPPLTTTTQYRQPLSSRSITHSPASLSVSQYHTTLETSAFSLAAPQPIESPGPFTIQSTMNTAPDAPDSPQPLANASCSITPEPSMLTPQLQGYLETDASIQNDTSLDISQLQALPSHHFPTVNQRMLFGTRVDYSGLNTRRDLSMSPTPVPATMHDVSSEIDLTRLSDADRQQIAKRNTSPAVRVGQNNSNVLHSVMSGSEGHLLSPSSVADTLSTSSPIYGHTPGDLLPPSLDVTSSSMAATEGPSSPHVHGEGHAQHILTPGGGDAQQLPSKLVHSTSGSISHPLHSFKKSEFAVSKQVLSSSGEYDGANFVPGSQSPESGWNKDENSELEETEAKLQPSSDMHSDVQYFPKQRSVTPELLPSPFSHPQSPVLHSQSPELSPQSHPQSPMPHSHPQSPEPQLTHHRALSFQSPQFMPLTETSFLGGVSSPLIYTPLKALASSPTTATGGLQNFGVPDTTNYHLGSTGYQGTTHPYQGTPPYKGVSPPYQGATPPYQGATQVTTPPYQGATPPFQGATPPYQGATPLYQGATPPYQGATPPYQGATPPYQGTTPPYQGATPYQDATSPYQGATPSYEGTAPPYQGPYQASPNYTVPSTQAGLIHTPQSSPPSTPQPSIGHTPTCSEAPGPSHWQTTSDESLVRNSYSSLGTLLADDPQATGRQGFASSQMPAWSETPFTSKGNSCSLLEEISMPSGAVSTSAPKDSKERVGSDSGYVRMSAMSSQYESTQQSCKGLQRGPPFEKVSPITKEKVPPVMSQSHSLQDALLKKRLDFVKKSQERMENLVANALKRQQNGGGPMAGKTRATKQGHSPSLIKTPVTTKGAPGIGGKYVAKKDQRSKSEVQSHSNSNVGVSKGKVSVQMLLPSAKQSEKIRKKEMKERNLRFYNRLPEVKYKREEEQRSKEYSENRKKAKVFQQQIQSKRKSLKSEPMQAALSDEKVTSYESKPPFK